MSSKEDSEVDSELAALLDEELFSDGDAAGAEVQAPHEAAADDPEQQQHKRPRWSSLEPEQIELDDEDKEFLETYGLDQDSSEGDENAKQQDSQQDQQQDADTAGNGCPPHPGWWRGMCIRCAIKKPEEDPAQQGAAAANKAALTKIKHLHHKQALEVGLLLGDVARWAAFSDSPAQLGSKIKLTAVTRTQASQLTVCTRPCC